MNARLSRPGGDKGNVQIVIAVVLSAVLTAAVSGPMAFKAMQARDRVKTIAAASPAPTTTEAPTPSVATTAPATTTTTTTTTTSSTTTTTQTPATTRPTTTTTKAPVTTTTAPRQATTTTSTTRPTPLTTTTTVPSCHTNGLAHGLYLTDGGRNPITGHIPTLVGPNFLVVGDKPGADIIEVFLDDVAMTNVPLRTIRACDYADVIAPLIDGTMVPFVATTLNLAAGIHTVTIRYAGGATPEVITTQIVVKLPA